MNSQTYISLAEGLRRVATAEARRYFPDEDDVEDMAQEVMLRTWEKHLVLKPDERMLLAYVATLTRNLCKDKLKVKRRHPVLRLLWRTKEDEEETYILPSCDTPQSQMELTETARIYRHAMQQLPYNWRQIMLMRGEEEMSYEQIARILGTTESSVRGTLSKAKKRMLNLIKQKLEE